MRSAIPDCNEPRPSGSGLARSLTVAARGNLPKISVVTPNFNGAATLRETLDSVLEQDYPNLEYIVVDGGSTDDSHSILNDYRPYLADLLIGSDRTMYDGIAKGFDQATGEVLAWLNSDDLYEPGILHRVGRTFARHPRWDVIYFDGTIWKQGWRVPNRPQRQVSLPELLEGHMLYQEGVFFRRRAYQAVGGLGRGFRLAGDYDLWLRLAARYRFHYIPEHAGCFRLRPGQLSADWPAYHAEMRQARRQLEGQLPSWYHLAGLPGRWLRDLLNRVAACTGSPICSLCNEHGDWAPAEEPPPVPLFRCRCPRCGDPPRRLLFSKPDPNGRTVRRVYRCDGCAVAFLFPPPATLPRGVPIAASFRGSGRCSR